MKKINNRTLIITFSVLVAIFVLTRLFRTPGLDSNLDGSTFKVDTAEITEIRLRPKKDSAEIRLVRTGNQWNATYNDIRADVPTGKIRNLLDVIHRLKPERVVSRKKEKWENYQVSDSSATDVSILHGDRTLLKMKVGKESGNTTYARVADENDIYALEGGIQSSFNTAFSDWRNHSFLRLTKNTVRAIEFSYPADSSFILEKRDKKWMIGNRQADSTKVDAYLNRLVFKDHDSFADHFSSAKDPDVTITFRSEGNITHVVKGWRRSFDEWVMNSSLQPATYFLDRGPVLARDLFANKQSF